MLIIGGSGLVGSTLISYAVSDFSLYATVNKNEIQSDRVIVTKIDLLQERQKIADLISTLRPDIIVNTVAHDSVDLCETDHKIADLLHVEVLQDIAKVSKKTGSKLIHLSTDFVFEGSKEGKYTENDIPKPVNYYGNTKLLGENIVIEQSENNVVLRPAVIYGWHKKSRFTNWIIETLQAGKSVNPHADQCNTPTLVDDLCKAILKVIELGVSGLYNSTGKTCLSRYEFAQALADGFGLDKKLIKPVTSQEKKQLAPRPCRTCLDSTKLEKRTGFEFSDINTGISFIFNKSKQNS
ncbi:MAG: SDR family oxidoreductase [Thaumarchaeota archaeon]|nr:SDR family oxidoreductase [Nitrososphaerota archaeon]